MIPFFIKIISIIIAQKRINVQQKMLCGKSAVRRKIKSVRKRWRLHDEEGEKAALH